MGRFVGITIVCAFGFLALCCEDLDEVSDAAGLPDNNGPQSLENQPVFDPAGLLPPDAKEVAEREAAKFVQNNQAEIIPPLSIDWLELAADQFLVAIADVKNNGNDHIMWLDRDKIGNRAAELMVEGATEPAILDLAENYLSTEGLSLIHI